MLVGHTKCGTGFIDQAVRETGSVAICGSNEIAGLTVHEIQSFGKDQPLYAYHQNAVHIPQYLEKLQALKGPVFIIYRNPVDAALSLVRQVLQGRDGPVNVGVNQEILVNVQTLGNAYEEFVEGAFREIIVDRYDYDRTSRVVREAFPAEQIKEYLFEDVVGGSSDYFKNLSHALGVNISPLHHRYSATFAPRNRLLYHATGWLYHRLTGKNSSIARHAATDEKSWSPFSILYRLNEMPASNHLTEYQRRDVLQNLPFDYSSFLARTGLNPNWQ